MLEIEIWKSVCDELGLTEKEYQSLIHRYPDPKTVLFETDSSLLYVLPFATKSHARKIISLVAELLYGLEDNVLDAFFSHEPFADDVENEGDEKGLRADCGSIGGIIELSGLSAVGKTQFALHLALCVQMPTFMGGLAGGCVYLCTEDSFPCSRLYQMEPHFQSLLKSSSRTSTEDCEGGSDGEIVFGDNVHVKHILDGETLVSVLQTDLLVFFDSIMALTRQDSCNIKYLPIKLLVIDSIAAVYRGESISTLEKASMLSQTVAALNRLQDEFGIMILVVNQVTDWLEPEFTYNNNLRHRSNSLLLSRESIMGGLGTSTHVPSLGLSWSYAIKTRLFLERPNPSSSLRKLSILYSNAYCKGSCIIDIDSSGIKGI